MGTTESKDTHVTGDPQVQVLNKLEVHENMHIEHDRKITIILVIVTVQLIITVYRLYKEHTRTQAIKAAKSLADITRA